VFREFEGLAHGINDPPEDCLARSPGAVALAQLLERGRFLALSSGLRLKDLINGVQHHPPQCLPAPRSALDHADKIIDEHVDLGERLGEHTGSGLRRRTGN
jgi:hypothetical protein